MNWMKNTRDWCISRQLWWGHQIPAWYCDDCGETVVAKSAPCTCPKCGSSNMTQDPDTLDTWFSSQLWTFATQGWPQKPELLEGHHPTTALVTARDIIALWVARMVMSSLYFLDEVPFKDVVIYPTILAKDGSRMSKSKGNVVPPSSVIEPYGADTMRLAILFIAPPEKDFDWDPKAVEGANRFIKRAWRIVWQLVQSGDANVAFDKSALDEVAMKLYRERHRTIAKCTEDFDRGQFNTAISAVMELVNAASAYLNATEGASRDKALCYGVAKDIVSVLAPICPFWADELWHEALGCEGNAYTAAWPEFDLAESIEDTVQIVVQVLGKVRGRIDVARDASNEEMQAAAEAAVAKWLEGKTVVKAICVPGKLVNLVVK